MAPPPLPLTPERTGRTDVTAWQPLYEPTRRTGPFARLLSLFPEKRERTGQKGRPTFEPLARTIDEELYEEIKALWLMDVTEEEKFFGPHSDDEGEGPSRRPSLPGDR